MNNKAAKIVDLMATIGPYFGIEDRNRLLAYRLLETNNSVLGEQPAISPDRMEASKKDPILRLAETLMNVTDGGRYVADAMEEKVNTVDGKVNLTPTMGILSSLRDIATAHTAEEKGNTSDVIKNLKDGKYFQIWTNKAIASDFEKDLGEALGGYFHPAEEKKNNPAHSLFAGVTGDFTFDIDGPPSKEKPGVSIFRVIAPELWIHNHDSGLTAMWCAGIPPIELSQCVPYLDVRFISDRDVPTTEAGKLGGFPSTTKHALGTKMLSPEETEWANARSIDNLSQGKGSSKELSAEEEFMKISGAEAGMELFTMPQTWSAARDDFIDNSDDWPVHSEGPLKGQYYRGGSGRSNPVLNKFRPMMTITGFDVSVMSSNPVISTKSATLTMVMHDRSRMGEIVPFVRADRTGGMECLVEWGWSHPSATSDYGKILNMTRRKEKFIITDTHYNFDTTGQVTITVKLMSKGQGRLRFGLIAESDLQSQSVQKIDEAAAAISKMIKDASVAGEDISKAAFGKSGKIAHFSSTEQVMAIRGDDLNKLLEEAKKRIQHKQVLSGDPGELYNHIHNCVTNMEKYRNILKETFKSSLDKIEYVPVKGQDDPWLPIKLGTTSGQTESKQVAKETGAELMKLLKSYFFINHEEYISFAKLFTLFCLPAVLRTQKFDDIQIYFYPFNYNSGYLRHLTIGEFPIPIKGFKSAFDEFIQSQANPSILMFLTFLITTFVIDKTNPTYGFSALFEKTKDGKNKKQSWVTEDRFVERVDLVLNLAYGVTAGHPKFKEPRVKVKMDTVPSVSSETGSILRIHIYDDCANSYNTFNDVLQEAQDTALGTMNDIVGNIEEKLSGAVYDSEGKVIKLTGCTERAKQLAQQQMDLLVATGLVTKVPNASRLESLTAEEVAALAKDQKPAMSAFTRDQMNLSRFGVTASPKVLKYVISSRMPTLKYGSEHSVIKNATIGSEADQKFATLQLSRRFKQGKGTGLGSNSETGMLPLQVNPVNLSLTTIGCPFFEHGQQFFFDFQTGTSIDNVYLVTGVEHSLKPGDFETTLKLIPVDKYGYMQTMTETLASLKTKIGQLHIGEAALEKLADKPVKKYRPSKKRGSKPVKTPDSWKGDVMLDDEWYLGLDNVEKTEEYIFSRGRLRKEPDLMDSLYDYAYKTPTISANLSDDEIVELWREREKERVGTIVISIPNQTEEPE